MICNFDQLKTIIQGVSPILDSRLLIEGDRTKIILNQGHVILFYLQRISSTVYICIFYNCEIGERDISINLLKCLMDVKHLYYVLIFFFFLETVHQTLDVIIDFVDLLCDLVYRLYQL